MVKKKSKKSTAKKPVKPAKVHDGVKAKKSSKSKISKPSTKANKTKKAYKDKFLGKEVELSSSAYDVYTDLKKDPGRMLAIRSEAAVVPAIKKIDEDIIQQLVNQEISKTEGDDTTPERNYKKDPRRKI
jgi:phage major head subunit gpT-like protein